MNQTQTSPARLSWVDYLRGPAIFMVVFGHCFTGLGRVDVVTLEGYFHGVLRGFIHPLAMPIFFILSGMFSVWLADRPWPSVLANRAAGIAYPYVLWVLIHGSILALATGFANNTATLSDFTNMWFRAPYHFWFLYALFFVSLTYVALRKAGLSNGAILLISVALYATIPYIGMGTWPGIYFTRQHLLFFAFGAWLSYQTVDAQLARADRRVLAVIATVGIGIVLAYALIVWKRPVTHLTVLLVAFGATGFTALAGLLARDRRFTMIELWGRRSLEIYVAHAIFVAGTRIILMRLGVEHWFPHIVLGTALGLYAPIVLWRVSQAAGLPFLFTLKPTRGGAPTVTVTAAATQQAGVPIEAERRSINL